MRIVSSKSGVTKMVIIALVVIIVVGGIIAAYITLHPSTSSLSTHIVDWTKMANYQTDFWNISLTSSYVVVLNDSMTVLNGSQYLDITGHNSSSGSTEGVWEVEFINSTYFHYCTFISGVTHDSGNLGCPNGIVQVSVTNVSIMFAGISSFTSNQTFENLGKITTVNDDGNFNGGELGIDVH
jgi:hypothetical protein